jgi:hypothetical protein
LTKDCKTNWAMAANWHLLMGFEVLTLRLFCGVIFTSLTGHPIMDKDTVGIGVCVLNHTVLFAEEYKTWILRGDDPRKLINCVSLKKFWENSVQIVAFTSVPASQHNNGMAATN